MRCSQRQTFKIGVIRIFSIIEAATVEKPYNIRFRSYFLLFLIALFVIASKIFFRLWDILV